MFVWKNASELSAKRSPPTSSSIRGVPGDQLVEPALRRLADAGGLGPDDALHLAERDGERLGVEVARRGDQAHLLLPGAPALAHDEVAQEADLGAAVVGAESLLAAGGEREPAQLVAALGREQAVVDVQDPLPGAGRVEAADEPAVVAGAEGVLELVAVAPLLDGGDDRLQLEALEAAEPPQRVADLLLLDLELALVGEDLPGRAGVVGDGSMRSGPGSRTSIVRASA